MIPAMIESHLRQRHPRFVHHTHRTAATGQELAAAEHVSGYRVAKPVVVKLDGKLALVVVAATDRVNLGQLEEATAAVAELALEAEFTRSFEPCDPGAEPPLALFGVPIYVDAKLVAEPKLVMPGGTHEDSVILDTREWMQCERVQAIEGLGTLVRSSGRLV